MPVKPHFESSSQWVLSGAGGSVWAARTSYSCVRRRSSIDSRNCRSGLASSGASADSLRSSSISSCDSSSACRPTFAALPSDLNEGREASANGPSSVNVSSRWGAAFRRSPRSGVCSSVSLPSSTIVGLSSSRKVGKSSNCLASSARRVALISAVSPASTTQRATSCFFCSSSATTRSESVMKSWMILFCSPRISSTSLVSRRPGWARLRTSWMSSGRPARPVPSSARISRRRSRYGRRMTLRSRSSGTTDEVCSIGSRLPSGSSSGADPGSQST